jgi:hypothetical protein
LKIARQPYYRTDRLEDLLAPGLVVLARQEAIGRTSGREDDPAPPEKKLTWAKAQVSGSSGGRI